MIHYILAWGIYQTLFPFTWSILCSVSVSWRSSWLYMTLYTYTIFYRFSWSEYVHDLEIIDIIYCCIWSHNVEDCSGLPCNIACLKKFARAFYFWLSRAYDPNSKEFPWVFTYKASNHPHTPLGEITVLFPITRSCCTTVLCRLAQGRGNTWMTMEWYWAGAYQEYILLTLAGFAMILEPFQSSCFRKNAVEPSSMHSSNMILVQLQRYVYLVS